MRIAVVYDCLFPHTVGGAERWYRNLAERLAGAGHEVTYLTLRQWPRDSAPDAPAGVRVVAVGPRLGLYTADGRRRILPPLVFGAGVLWHLLRHGRRYDVVHSASFPYFSLLAAGLVRPLRRYRLVVDWHEVWSAGYWREYLGTAGGRIGRWVQRRCARLPQRAFCFSALHAARLHDEGLRGEVTVLRGEYAGDLTPPAPAPAADPPTVVFAGRLIPEKQAAALVPAIALARETLPELRCAIYGDGPQLAELRELIAARALQDVITTPGFVGADELARALREALCLVLPSRREGYGLVVVEAASQGTPSVVVAGEDNAAVELIDEGGNGLVAPDAGAAALAAAIVAVDGAGPDLRERTCAWFERSAPALSIERSLATVLDAYAGAASARS